MARLRAESVLNLHRNLSRCSELWQSQKQTPCLQSYCFSHGIAHILISGEPRRAESLLTDFDYCIARVATVERKAIRQMRDNLYIDSWKVAWSVDFPFPITDFCQDDSGEKCAISIGNCSINVLSR